MQPESVSLSGLSTDSRNDPTIRISLSAKGAWYTLVYNLCRVTHVLIENLPLTFRNILTCIQRAHSVSLFRCRARQTRFTECHPITCTDDLCVAANRNMLLSKMSACSRTSGHARLTPLLDCRLRLRGYNLGDGDDRRVQRPVLACPGLTVTLADTVLRQRFSHTVDTVEKIVLTLRRRNTQRRSISGEQNE